MCPERANRVKRQKSVDEIAGAVFDQGELIFSKVLTPGNLDHLKHLLDKLSYTLEVATLGNKVDSKFDDSLISDDLLTTGSPSDKYLNAPLTAKVEEVNFIRLCYSYLRFYNRVWPHMENTDVPTGVILSDILNSSECSSDKSVSFKDFQAVKQATIYPLIGLYSFNPRWAMWAYDNKPIRSGDMKRLLRDFWPKVNYAKGNSMEVGRYYRFSITVYNEFYSIGNYKCSWAYILLNRGGYNDPDVRKQFYLSAHSSEVRLNSYYEARRKFFERALKHMDAIFEDYQLRKYRILWSSLDYGSTTTDTYDVNVFTEGTREPFYIDEVFANETGKYALIHLLTMNQFCLRGVDTNKKSGSYKIIVLKANGLKAKDPQSFESWDDNRFIAFCKEKLKIESYQVAPDFQDVVSLFRWIGKHLKSWDDPMKGTDMEKLLRNFPGVG